MINTSSGVLSSLTERLAVYRSFVPVDSLDEKLPVLQDPAGSLGNIHEITQPPPSESFKNKHLEKWCLQSVAKKILGWERFEKCFKTRISSKVDILLSPGGSRAHYKGLSICGSVWVCPVCAMKITERRRQELAYSLSAAQDLGLTPYLLTLTIRHDNGDRLEDLLDKFSKARGFLMNRKTWKGWKNKIGFVGSVRSLEVTHGENGWHVHTHEILFCRLGVQPAQMDILPFWQSACLSAGLPMPNEHGVDIVSGNKDIGNYVSKWGMDSELTKSMIKRGRLGRRSPWDFLRDYFSTGEKRLAELFSEYAKNFKGKRQLVWSDGLRAMFGLGVQVSDEELAEEIEEGSIILGSLSVEQWRLIYRNQKRGEALELALQGIDKVYEYVDSLSRGS